MCSQCMNKLLNVAIDRHILALNHFADWSELNSTAMASRADGEASTQSLPPKETRVPSSRADRFVSLQRSQREKPPVKIRGHHTASRILGGTPSSSMT